MVESKPVVLFVDDELALLEQFGTVLKYDGYDVLSAGRADDVLNLIDEAGRIDIAILDLQLPIEGSDQIPPMLKKDGGELGLILGDKLRKKFSDVPIVFWSGSADETLWAKTLNVKNIYTLQKNIGPERVRRLVGEILNNRDGRPNQKAFIVHGHAYKLLDEFREWLEQEYNSIEPIVLRDVRSGGETLIDKFETNALGVDLVFVLLTPDDTVLSSRDDYQSRRARQNVVFEMGYFFGRLGRKTGRVILLSQGEVELPSDIHGMLTIDVSEGIAAAGDAIRREIDRRV